MSVHRFGTLPDGSEVLKIRLRNAAGMSCDVITLGAAVQDLMVPLAAGSPRRVVLGFPGLDGYLADSNYMGAIAGRYASRITRGRLRIDGRDYQLSINDRGRNHLHGGSIGFSARQWQVLASDETSVLLGLTSPDGDQGYPGTVEVRCLYRLEPPATLRVVMTAATDAPTVVSLAHHSYFCLQPGEPIRGHALRINARLHTPLDDENLPTGEVRLIQSTPLDFRSLRPIDAADHDYDMVFVLDRSGDTPTHAARLVAPDQRMCMDLYTTEPCLVFYDGSHIAPGPAGNDGQAYGPFAGLCLEPIRFPDSPNQQAFPDAVLRSGAVYRQVTEYRFQGMFPDETATRPG